MKNFSVSTHQRTEFVDITSQVARAVAEMGVKDGVITVFCPHTNGGLTINEC
jgi:secondary thiamine-phosphate synthase enzyme